MSESVEAAVTGIEQALDALLAAVQAELARVALEEGITKMDFGLGSTYYRGTQEVDCRRLDEVEDRYLRYASGGFLAYWTVAEGWT